MKDKTLVIWRMIQVEEAVSKLFLKQLRACGVLGISRRPRGREWRATREQHKWRLKG